MEATAADAVPGEEFCSGPLDRVEFSGNRKTRPQVLLGQIESRPGRECSLDEIVDGTQSIMDLSLFKKVTAKLTKTNAELVLHYTVDEKISFVPIPRFSRTSDGELRYGLQLRWDNFAGFNHKLRITSERRQENDGRGRSGHYHQLNYRVPRFFGTDHGFSFGLLNVRKQAELSMDDIIYGESLRHDNIAKFSFSRWMNQYGVTEGLQTTFGLVLQRRDHELEQGELGPFSEGVDVFAHVGFEKRSVRDDLYRLRGQVYGMKFRMSSGGFQSDYSYNRTDFYLRKYQPLPGGAVRNFNYQLRLGYSTGGPFGERQFSIGGGDSLRGLAPRARTGDVLALVNAEYLSSFEFYQPLRWVVFADVGNVYRLQKIKPLKQKFGVGAGLRWKLLAFSNTDMRLDVARDFENHDFRVYVTTNLTF